MVPGSQAAGRLAGRDIVIDDFVLEALVDHPLEVAAVRRGFTVAAASSSLCLSSHSSIYDSSEP